jgi:hypothetical protein
VRPWLPSLPIALRLLLISQPEPIIPLLQRVQRLEQMSFKRTHAWHQGGIGQWLLLGGKSRYSDARFGSEG